MRGIKFAWLISGLIGMLLLCACRRDDAADNGAPHAAAPRTTITALVWAPDWPEQMLEIAAEFGKANPDVHVNVQFMIGNSIEENIKPRVAAGTLPDLMSVNPNAYAAELADQGVLADISQTAAWNHMLAPLKRDWTSQRGKGFGISGGVATTMIYYNREMFAQAGIARPPANFDEFLAACAQLKRAGFVPIMWNGGFPNMLGNGPFASGFANSVVAHEPNWRQKMADGTLDLNTPAVADIFARIALIPERGYVQPSFMTTGYDEGIRLFKQGKVAMAFQGSWAAGLMMHDNAFAAGVFVPPWNAPRETVVPILGSETGFAVCDTGNAANKAAATRFLEFIAGKGFSILQKKRHNISPFEHGAGTVASDPEIVDYAREVSRYPVTASPYYSSLPSNTIELVHNLMHDVLLRKITARQAAKRLDESVKTEAKMHYK